MEAEIISFQDLVYTKKHQLELCIARLQSNQQLPVSGVMGPHVHNLVRDLVAEKLDLIDSELQLVQTEFRLSNGSIDILAKKGDRTFYIIEVKTQYRGNTDNLTDSDPSVFFDNYEEGLKQLAQVFNVSDIDLVKVYVHYNLEENSLGIMISFGHEFREIQCNEQNINSLILGALYEKLRYEEKQLGGKLKW